jgi:hypothetical protein
MTALWLEIRGPVYLVLCGVMAGYAIHHAIALIRGRMTGIPLYPADWSTWQGRLLMTVYAAGAIGLVAVWVMLVKDGPSLIQVARGQSRGSPWVGSLFYTSAWLWSIRPIVPLVNRPDVAPAPNVHIGTRVAVLVLMFFLAIASIENW